MYEADRKKPAGMNAVKNSRVFSQKFGTEDTIDRRVSGSIIDAKRICDIWTGASKSALDFSFVRELLRIPPAPSPAKAVATAANA